LDSLAVVDAKAARTKAYEARLAIEMGDDPVETLGKRAKVKATTHPSGRDLSPPRKRTLGMTEMGRE
jgi:hypothetical protein